MQDNNVHLVASAQRRGDEWFADTINSLYRAAKELEVRRDEYRRSFGEEGLSDPETILSYGMSVYRNLNMNVRLDTPVLIGAELGMVHRHLRALAEEAKTAASMARRGRS